MPSNKVTSQRIQGKGGSSMKINYAVGSGSRPGGGKYKIESSNPSGTQKIRPANPIDNRKG